jgi:hypothetical protein
MLQIDHVNGGGRQHMKKIGVGVSFYKAIISENFPASYRVLCANHNWKHKANLAREKAGA